MTLTEILAREIETLPKDRQVDVLTFVRFLKIGLADTAALGPRFQAALAEARRQAVERGITDDDIDAEVKAVRLTGWDCERRDLEHQKSRPGESECYD